MENKFRQNGQILSIRARTQTHTHTHTCLELNLNCSLRSRYRVHNSLSDPIHIVWLHTLRWMRTQSVDVVFSRTCIAIASAIAIHDAMVHTLQKLQDGKIANNAKWHSWMIFFSFFSPILLCLHSCHICCRSFSSSVCVCCVPRFKHSIHLRVLFHIRYVAIFQFYCSL